MPMYAEGLPGAAIGPDDQPAGGGGGGAGGATMGKGKYAAPGGVQNSMCAGRPAISSPSRPCFAVCEAPKGASGVWPQRLERLECRTR